VKNETGTTLAKASSSSTGSRYYGVRETCTLRDGDTLELIHGIYPAKPEDTEEFSGSREVFTVSTVLIGMKHRITRKFPASPWDYQKIKWLCPAGSHLAVPLIGMVLWFC
jgi:hypothetical protein